MLKKLRAVGQEESQVALSEHEHQDGSDTSVPDTGGMAGAARSSAHPRCGAILQHPFLSACRGRTEMPLKITWVLGPVSCQAAMSIFSLFSSYQPPPPAASKDRQSDLPAPGLETVGKQRGGSQAGVRLMGFLWKE